MDGLGRRMPVTFSAFALGALSIIGVPPLAGAWSKLMLMGGAMQSEYVVIIFVLAVSSLLNLVYLGEIFLRGFFKSGPHSDGAVAEAPLACVIPLVITAIMSLALFFAVDGFVLDFGGM